MQPRDEIFRTLEEAKKACRAGHGTGVTKYPQTPAMGGKRVAEETHGEPLQHVYDTTRGVLARAKAVHDQDVNERVSERVRNELCVPCAHACVCARALTCSRLCVAAQMAST